MPINNKFVYSYFILRKVLSKIILVKEDNNIPQSIKNSQIFRHNSLILLEIVFEFIILSKKPTCPPPPQNPTKNK